jgi:hypothetical protein
VTRPLSRKEINRLTKAWDALGPDLDVYVVWMKTKDDGRVVFTEGPEFRTNPDDVEGAIEEAFSELLVERSGQPAEAPECIIRLFTSDEEAGFYMETVGGFMGLDPEQVEVVQMTVADLFEVRGEFIERARKHVNAGLRFDLSRARMEEFLPDTISTIWSSTEAPH